ncbi:MAG: metalloregulator ArsR/SmtB family transcription factor [Betaproteobacteria bacterium]
MNELHVLRALAALAQVNRLGLFRALVVAGPIGLCPGDLAGQLGLPAPSVSFHLKELLQADLVSQEREGRHLIYRANLSQMSQLLAYLTDHCCQGQACIEWPVALCGSPNARDDRQPMNESVMNK